MMYADDLLLFKPISCQKIFQLSNVMWISFPSGPSKTIFI